MRYLLGLVLALLASPAFAVTYHVAANGGCVNHGTIAATCSIATDCGTTASPCCTISAANNRTDPSLTSGDTVFIHQGTYGNSGGGDTYATLNKSGVTWTVQNADAVILDLQNQASIGLVFAATNITLAKGGGSIIFRNHRDVNTEAGRNGCVHIESDGGRIDGAVCENLLPSYTPQTISSYVCWRVHNADGSIIENTTCTGGFSTGVYIYDGMKTINAPGHIVRNNTFTSSRTDFEGLSTGIILQNLGINTNTDSIAVYNNVFDFTQATVNSVSRRPFYIRTGGMKIYIFNNYSKDVYWGFYMQDNDRIDPSDSNSPYYEERHFFFNNTFIGRAAGDAVKWPNCINADIRNNIFTGSFVGGAVLSSNCTLPANNSTHRNIQDTYVNNVCYGVYGPCYDLSGSEGVTNSGNVTGNPLVDATGHIAAGSSARNVGTNDPIDLGAGDCSITVLGETISCALDMDGTARGSTWDIGADQFGSAVCGNAVVDTGETCDDGGTTSCDGCSSSCQTEVGYTCGDGVYLASCETCDDGNTSTETVCPYNEPGGQCTYCNSICSAVLNLTGPYCGDSISQSLYGEICDTGPGYVLTSTCESLGFASGVLACATNCQSYNTSGCSLTASTDTLAGVTLSGVRLTHLAYAKVKGTSHTTPSGTYGIDSDVAFTNPTYAYDDSIATSAVGSGHHICVGAGCAISESSSSASMKVSFAAATRSGVGAIRGKVSGGTTGTVTLRYTVDGAAWITFATPTATVNTEYVTPYVTAQDMSLFAIEAIATPLESGAANTTTWNEAEAYFREYTP